MTLFLCITVICFTLIWKITKEKKVYSHTDMLWALYVTGKEQRVRENGTS